MKAKTLSILISRWCIILAMVILALGQPAPLLSHEAISTGRGMTQPYGVNIMNNELFWRWVDSKYYPQLANLLSEAGVQWVRIRADWYLFEPQPKAWNEAFVAKFGALFTALGNEKLKILLVLDEPPDWAGPPPHKGWARFVRWMVNHFDAQAWAIGNEVNLSSEYRGNKEAYVQMVKTAAVIIRDKDSRDLVALSAFSSLPHPNQIQYWLEHAGPYVDILSINKYGYEDREVLKAILLFKQYANQARVGNKPVWLTETNIRQWKELCDKDDFNCMNPPEGPRKLKSRYHAVLDMGVEKVFWWKEISSIWGPGLLIPPGNDIGYRPNGRMYSAYQNLDYNSVVEK